MWKTHFFRIVNNTASMPPAAWENAVNSGIVQDRKDYLRLLRNVSICGTRAQLAEYVRRSDLALIDMVRVLDEIDRVLNLLQERENSWVTSPIPPCTSGTSSLPIQRQVDTALIRSGNAHEILRKEVCHMQEVRKEFAKEVTAMAEQILPNSSTLVGGLVAARLLAEAGDLPSF
ncbi:MAG: hypothetical protein LUQ13_02910, partial [Methanomicrobiales archaeon]|nr:hypothetical protein [Methanomicrobiales archaeon]